MLSQEVSSLAGVSQQHGESLGRQVAEESSKKALPQLRFCDSGCGGLPEQMDPEAILVAEAQGGRTQGTGPPGPDVPVN